MSGAVSKENEWLLAGRDPSEMIAKDRQRSEKQFAGRLTSDRSFRTVRRLNWRLALNGPLKSFQQKATFDRQLLKLLTIKKSILD